MSQDLNSQMGYLFDIDRRKVERINTKQKIETACKVANITASELGRRMGMSQQTFSSRLKVGKFTQAELEKMADIMDCEYHSVFVFPDGNHIE